MAGSQKFTLWGPQRIPLGILRVKDSKPSFSNRASSHKLD